MEPVVVLVRGINVGSTRKLPMAELAARFPFAPAVIVRSGADWRALATSPIHAEVDDPTKRIVWVAKHPVDGAALAALDQAPFAPEVAVADGCEVHLHLPNGQGRAKLPDALAKALGSPVVTARNWRTVDQLAAMLDALPQR